MWESIKQTVAQLIPRKEEQPGSADQPKKQGMIKTFVKKNFFDEENIGLNSAKEISQTWDTNINKITRFIEAK